MHSIRFSASLTALHRIRKSFREKKSSSSACVSPATGHVGPTWSPKRMATVASVDEVAGLREDLQAARDEASASKEVIAILRRQVDAMHKERETL